MPIKYALNKDKNLIYASYTGRITTKDLESAFDELIEIISNWTTVIELVDLRCIGSLDISVQSIRDLAEKFSKRLIELNMAGLKVIVAQDDVVFGLARVYSAHAAFVGGLEVQVVRTISEALAH